MEYFVNYVALAILTHPFTWILIGLTAAFYLIQTLVHREARAKPAPSDIWDTFGLKRMTAPLRIALAALWALLFVAFLGGAVFSLIEAGKVLLRLSNPNDSNVLQMLLGTSKADFRLYLLTLAAMTAGLSAIVALPFTLIRTKNLEANTKATQQGLVTDRLNKAVEGLGAEKEVNWIGRPVTVWTGKAKERDLVYFDESEITLPERSLETRRSSGTTEIYDEETGDLLEAQCGYVHFKQWDVTQTVIEKQGMAEPWGDEDHAAEYGDWQVFKETVPNLEVRIGSIYALERIAKENDDYHVQVMEILCAYIRENAPASSAVDWPELEMRPSEENGPLWADFEDRMEDFRAASKALKATVKPRSDIQTALTVIGRRSEEQWPWEAEAGGGKPGDPFVFDTPCPVYEGDPDAPLGESWEAFQKALEAWKEPLRIYRGYRLDLRGTDLQGADLAGLILAGAQMEQAQMQGANLTGAQMQGAYLREAQMQGAVLATAQMQGAVLIAAQMQGADFEGAKMQAADFTGTKLLPKGAKGAKLQGANLSQARMQLANLHGAQMHRAIFRDAQMQGVDFRGAGMQRAVLISTRMQQAGLVGAKMHGASLNGTNLVGANLYLAQMQRAKITKARMQGVTSLGSANLQGALLWNLDCAGIPDLKDHVEKCFGDGTVTLPMAWGWPKKWPRHKLEENNLFTEWQEWLESPENYDPNKTSDQPE